LEKINFALVIHNHQPVDNDPAIIEEVFRTSYSPFLKKLSEFPLIKANLHYSGYLLEWLQEEHPEFIDLLRVLVNRQQVEILGGGYYEPILPCIPDEDGRGQVSLLRDRVNALFGSKAAGVWTAERVWEPRSPELLQESDVRYTLLDDTIFMSSGVPEEECFRPYLVESRGSFTTVFPISKTLRYLIPWKTEWNTIAYLRRNADGQGNRIAVLGDDGEKLGSWPTTHEKVYEKGWLNRFFGLLVRNRAWLTTVTLSEYLSEFGAHERTYLPSAAYDEMLGWSLPEGGSRRELAKGGRGLWRLFLSKYPEAGRLYSKMLSVSKLVHGISDDVNTDALHEVWKGQCNDVYWHGAFGGIYAANLRRVAYHHIITAQRIAEQSIHSGGGDWLTVGQENYNGNTEFSVDTSSLGLRLCPSLGGAVSELDFKGPALNILDVIAKGKEGYHAGLRRFGESMTRPSSRRREASAAAARKRRRQQRDTTNELLAYDRYPKFSFQEFLVEEGTTAKDFLMQTFSETPGLAGHPYDASVEMTAKNVTFNLSLRSKLLSGGATTLVSLQKRLTVPAEGAEITFGYTFEMVTDHPESRPRPVIELNLSSLGDRAFAEEYTGPVALSSITTQELRYPEIGISAYLTFSRPVDIAVVPLRTLSRSEAGFQTNLQGVSIIYGLGSRDRSEVSGIEIGLGLHSLAE
jgi:4-alpha-glucanotransferase